MLKALLYLFTAYFVTTLAGAILSVVLGYALGLPSYVEAGVKPSQSPAYKATEPLQPLLNLMVYSSFAFRHLRKLRKEELWTESLRLSYVGLLGSIVIDLVAFVLIPHPYAFTPGEFYVDYQPWITTIYLMIFAGPFLARAALVRIEKQRGPIH